MRHTLFPWRQFALVCALSLGVLTSVTAQTPPAPASPPLAHPIPRDAKLVVEVSPQEGSQKLTETLIRSAIEDELLRFPLTVLTSAKGATHQLVLQYLTKPGSERPGMYLGSTDLVLKVVRISDGALIASLPYRADRMLSRDSLKDAWELAAIAGSRRITMHLQKYLAPLETQ